MIKSLYNLNTRCFDFEKKIGDLYKTMRIFTDYHTHTNYSDARTTLQENFDTALKRGLIGIGITDHGYANPKKFALTPKKALEQKEKIIDYRKEYEKKGLTIYHGIEADIISTKGDIDLTKEQAKLFDYVICGFHNFPKMKSFSDFMNISMRAYLSSIIKPSCDVIKRNTQTYIDMLENNPISILAHINSGHIVDVKEITKCCADLGVIIELNCKHCADLTDEDLDTFYNHKVRLIASSDAHRIDEIGDFSRVENRIKDFPQLLELIENTRQDNITFRK